MTGRSTPGPRATAPPVHRDGTPVAVPTLEERRATAQLLLHRAVAVCDGHAPTRCGMCRCGRPTPCSVVAHCARVREEQESELARIAAVPHAETLVLPRPRQEPDGRRRAPTRHHRAHAALTRRLRALLGLAPPDRDRTPRPR